MHHLSILSSHFSSQLSKVFKADLLSDMDALFDVISRRHALLPADCMSALICFKSRISLITSRFAFVEYESRRDADDAYHEMHNKRIGRDDLLKIEVGLHVTKVALNDLTRHQWARTPPSASWRFDSGRDRRRDRTPPRRGRSPSPRRSRGDFSPRREERYERDYDRHDRGEYDRRDRDRDYDRRDRDYDRRDRDRERSRDRSRSPDERDREVKDDRERRDDDRERREEDRENGPNGEDRKGISINCSPFSS